MICHTRCQVDVLNWCHLANNSCREYSSIGVTSGDVGSGVADCYPQNIWNPRKNFLTNKANILVFSITLFT